MADMGAVARSVLLLLICQAAATPPALPPTQTSGTAEQQCGLTASLDLDGAVGGNA